MALVIATISAMMWVGAAGAGYAAPSTGTASGSLASQIETTPMTGLNRPIVGTPTLATTPVMGPASRPMIPATPEHLVVFGDSVPAGSACDCPGFGAEVASALSAELTNFSLPGLTSGGLVAQLESANVRASLRTATVVTVTVGANDFDENDATDAACSDLSCYATTMGTVTANVNSIVARIRALTPSGTRIIITGYWNVFLDGHLGAAKGPTYVATSDALSRALNSHLSQLSTLPDVFYTDIYSPFKGTGTVDDSALLASDGDHPDAAGHRIIADAIEATLRAHGGTV